MSEFLRYPHLERFGNLEVEGIEIGETYVFPKIDGTNASMWLTPDKDFCYGSRNRQLSLGKDNAGFMAAMQTDYSDNYRSYLSSNPNHVLYGEWLVPHTLKGYRDDAWNKFYVFDVFNKETGKFIPYDDYSQNLQGMDYVPCYRKVRNGNYEMFQRIAKEVRFLLQDSQEFGEGIVIKNYGYQNKFHRTTWAKLVLSEFKEENLKAFGPDVLGTISVEEVLVDKLVTKTLVNKEYQKLEVEGWSSKRIPQLLETVYRCLIVEELYDYLKKNIKEPINFKVVKHFVVEKIKVLKPELF